ELTLQKASRPRGLLEAVARRPQQNDAARAPNKSRIVDESLLHDESAHAVGDQDQRVVRRQGGLREIGRQPLTQSLQIGVGGPELGNVETEARSVGDRINIPAFEICLRLDSREELR